MFICGGVLVGYGARYSARGTLLWQGCGYEYYVTNETA